MLVKWMRLLTLITLSLVALCLVAKRGVAAEPEKVDVYVNGDGYRLYRIPSLICTPKGILLAFCEGRSGNDQSATDMVLKRSLDGGKTWLPMQVLVKAVPEAAMDPTAVIDRITGTIVLVYDRWPKIPEGEKLGEHKRSPGLGRDSITTWVMTSKDEGVTWSEPVDITAMTKQPEWAETGHGPGLGIQTRSGRLVIPCFICVHLRESVSYFLGTQIYTGFAHRFFSLGFYLCASVRICVLLLGDTDLHRLRTQILFFGLYLCASARICVLLLGGHRFTQAPHTDFF